ncbi:MAG TPA: hypothetical protein VFC63_17255 [Blastocatellia bacterium]|nr:hypothetical protein [Blastocatellia bacterium]
MRIKSCLICCFVLLSAVALFAQSGSKAGDPISGTWRGEPQGVTFELRYDGKSAVTGMVTPQPGEIKKGTFDSKTGALRLEGDATPPDGGPQCRFVIEGKVENGVASGTAVCGETKVGDFKMTRE